MALVLPVSELRQDLYCSRVVYFHHLLPGAGRATAKMNLGKEAHTEEQRKEVRRVLERYGMTEGNRHFGVWLRSEELGLSGKADMIVENGEEAFVIDFKLTSGEPVRGHYLQVTAYSMLVEACLGWRTGNGFLFRLADSKLFGFRIEEEMREQVRETAARMRSMVGNEEFPAVNVNRNRCTDCEYKNFCGDVW
jgi:CRISPR-associated exonuclease Cas4